MIEVVCGAGAVEGQPSRRAAVTPDGSTGSVFRPIQLRMRLVGGDHERNTRGFQMLDCKRERQPVLQQQILGEWWVCQMNGPVSHSVVTEGCQGR